MDESELKVIQLSKAGSNSYGTNTPESDLDVRGIGVAPAKYYIGLNKFEQKDKGWDEEDEDKVIYDIRKFCNLALKCNPNVIEMLFVNEEDIIQINDSGKLLRANGNLFISKRARHSFMGYAISQLKRIRTHRNWLLHPIEKAPLRTEFDLPEDKKLISNDQMGAFLWIIANLLKSSPKEKALLSQTTIDELNNINYIGMVQSSIPDNCWNEIKAITGASDNFVEAAMKEKAYANAKAQYDSYMNWKKTRNPKRAELEAKCGYDSKHAMHLIRLIRMGEEILTGRGVIVKRPDAKELLEIRNGSWTFEQVEEYVNGMDRKFEELYKTSTIPHDPNYAKIEDICMEIIQKEIFTSNTK